MYWYAKLNNGSVDVLWWSFLPPRWRRLMFVVLWINNILYCTRRVCCCWRSRKAQSISSLEFSTPKPDRLPTTKCLATVRQLLSLFPFISSQPFNTALKAHFYNVCIWKRLCWYTLNRKITRSTIFFFFAIFLQSAGAKNLNDSWPFLGTKFDWKAGTSTGEVSTLKVPKGISLLLN